jgi:hypothetical protein
MSVTDAPSSRGGVGLPWLADVLGWTITPEGERASRADDRRRMFVLPGRDRPRFLVSAEPRVAGGTLRTFNDSMSQLARIRKAMLGAVIRLGLDGLIRLDGVVVGSSVPDDEPTLLEYLGSALGHPVEVGVALGRELRPNMKPVLQVLTPRGELVAFAKVGWNELTNGLIDNEVSSIGGLHATRPRAFDLPDLLHAGTWAGRGILLVSPGPRPLIRRCALNAPPPVAVEEEVSGSAWSSVEPMGTSRYVGGLRGRLTASQAGRDDPSADPIAALDAVVERWGDREMPFGAWHGDWAPWNMSRSKGRVFVWDWERYGGPVPVGFDHLHFRFQVDYQVGDRSVEAAANDADGSLRASVLPSVVRSGEGLGPEAQLYLIERIARVQEGRAAGVAVRSDLAPAALELLGRQAS